MPSIALFAPVVIPLATAGAVALCGVAGWKIDRIVLAVGSWAAILALIALWAPVRATQEVSLGQLGFGAPLHLRLDGVGFAFALMVMMPAAFLLTMQPRAWQEGTVAALGLAAAVLAVGAGGGVVMAVGGGGGVCHRAGGGAGGAPPLGPARCRRPWSVAPAVGRAPRGMASAQL